MKIEEWWKYLYRQKLILRGSRKGLTLNFPTDKVGKLQRGLGYIAIFGDPTVLTASCHSSCLIIPGKAWALCDLACQEVGARPRSTRLRVLINENPSGDESASTMRLKVLVEISKFPGKDPGLPHLGTYAPGVWGAPEAGRIYPYISPPCRSCAY